MQAPWWDRLKEGLVWRFEGCVERLIQSQPELKGLNLVRLLLLDTQGVCNGHLASSLAGRLSVGLECSQKSGALTSGKASSLPRLSIALPALALSALPFLLFTKLRIPTLSTIAWNLVTSLSSCQVSGVRSLVWRNGHGCCAIVSIATPEHYVLSS